MDFTFDVWRALKPDNSGVAVLEPTDLSIRTREVYQIIDAIGFNSSQAQGLGTIITTASKFFSTSDNKLYVKVSGNQVMGFLKTGYRRLFHTSATGKLTELYPLCLLDFYMHESCQRLGLGKELYKHMLQRERTTPAKIAIDRPSVKLLQFMQKHYSLSDYIPQMNYFVIYDQFFTTDYQRSHSSMPNTGLKDTKASYLHLTPTRLPPRPKEELKMNARAILGQNRPTDLYSAMHKYRPIPPWATAETLRSRTPRYLNS